MPMPKGVESGLKQTLASVKKGAPGTIQQAAEHWGRTTLEVKNFAAHHKAEIDDLRGKISEGCFLLAGQMMGELSKAMASKKKMKETPVRDMAQSIEKLVNSGTTAADGHQPLIKVDFGDLRAGRDMLAERRRKEQEMKQLKAREVA